MLLFKAVNTDFSLLGVKSPNALSVFVQLYAIVAFYATPRHVTSSSGPVIITTTTRGRYLIINMSYELLSLTTCGQLLVRAILSSAQQLNRSSHCDKNLKSH